MDEQTCPRCKTTTYNNHFLKLLVNVCGHTLCESCVELLFSKGSGACPQCGVPLRRSNFRIQMFDDPLVEKDINIRKRILRDYNKREDDFNSIEEYNDYLEEIESIIYNLVNDIDIINTNKRIEQYKKENKEIILKNRNKLSREEAELNDILDMEKQQNDLKRLQRVEMEQEERKKKIRDREALLDKLMYTDEDAFKVVCGFQEKNEREKKEAAIPPPKAPIEFSSGIKIASTESRNYLPIPKPEDEIQYVRNAPKVWSNGPPPPEASEIERQGYIKHVRAEHPVEKSGGYRSILACQRALQEAMQGLFYGS